jgi:hypothetical protein
MLNYYEILDLKCYAESAEIKRAYKKLAVKYHPDKPSGSEEKFKLISEAYQFLSDPDEKARYDQALKEFNAADPMLARQPELRVHIPGHAGSTISTSSALAVLNEGVDFSELLTLARVNEESLLGYVLKSYSLGFTMLQNADFFNALGKILQIQILIILFEDQGAPALKHRLIEELKTETGKKYFYDALSDLAKKQKIDLNNFYITSHDLLLELPANDIYQLAFEYEVFLFFILRHFPEALQLNKFLALQKKYNIFRSTIENIEFHLPKAYEHIANRRIQDWGKGLQVTFKLLLRPKAPEDLAWLMDDAVRPDIDFLKSSFSLKELSQILIYWGESFDLYYFLQVALCVYKLMDFYTDDELHVEMSKSPANYEVMVTYLNLLMRPDPLLYPIYRQSASRDNPAVGNLVNQAMDFLGKIDINRLLTLILKDSSSFNCGLTVEALPPAVDKTSQAILSPETQKLLDEFFMTRYSPFELVKALMQDSEQLTQHLKAYKSSLIQVIKILLENHFLYYHEAILPLLSESLSAHTFTLSEKSQLPEVIQKMINAQEVFAQYMRNLDAEMPSALTFDDYQRAIADSYFYPQLFHLNTNCCMTISDLLQKAQSFLTRKLLIKLPKIQKALVILVITVINSNIEKFIQEVFQHLYVVEKDLVDLLWDEIVARNKINDLFEIIPGWFDRQITGRRLAELSQEDQEKLSPLLLDRLSAFNLLSPRLRLGPKYSSLIEKTENNIFPQEHVDSLADLLHRAGIDRKTLKLLSEKLEADHAMPLLLFLLELLQAEPRYQENIYLYWAISDLKKIEPAIKLEMHFFTAAKEYLTANQQSIAGEKLKQLLALFDKTLFEGRDCSDYLSRIQAADEIDAIVAASVVSGAAASSASVPQYTATGKVTFDELKKEIFLSIALDGITESLQKIKIRPSNYLTIHCVDELNFIRNFFHALNSSQGDVLTVLAELAHNHNEFDAKISKELLLQLWQEKKISDKQKENSGFIHAFMQLLFECQISFEELGLLSEEPSLFAQNLFVKIKDKFQETPEIIAFQEKSLLGIFIRQALAYEEEERAIKDILSITPKFNEQEESWKIYQVIKVFLEKQLINHKTFFANQKLLLNHPILWQIFLRGLLEKFSVQPLSSGINLDKKEIEKFLAESENRYGICLSELYFSEEALHYLNHGKSFSLHQLSILNAKFSLAEALADYLKWLLEKQNFLLVETALRMLNEPLPQLKDRAADRSCALHGSVSDLLGEITGFFVPEDTVEKLTKKKSFDRLREALYLIPLTQKNAIPIFILLFSLQYSENLMQFLFFSASYFPEFEAKLSQLFSSKPPIFWREYVNKATSIQVRLAIVHRLFREHGPDKGAPFDVFLKLVKEFSPALMTRIFSSPESDQSYRLLQFMGLSNECFNIFVNFETVLLVFEKIPVLHREEFVKRLSPQLTTIVLAGLTHEANINPVLLWSMIEKIGFSEKKIFTLDLIRLLPKHRFLKILFEVNSYEFAENLVRSERLSDGDQNILAALRMFREFSRDYYVNYQYEPESKSLDRAMNLLRRSSPRSADDPLACSFFQRPLDKDCRVLEKLVNDLQLRTIGALLEEIYRLAPRFFTETPKKHVYFSKLEYLSASIGLSIEEFSARLSSRPAVAAVFAKYSP